MRRRNSKLNFKWAVSYLIRQGNWHEWGSSECNGQRFVNLRYGDETTAGRLIELNLVSSSDGKFLDPQVKICTRAQSQNVHLTAYCAVWSRKDLDDLFNEVCKLLTLQGISLSQFEPYFVMEKNHD